MIQPALKSKFLETMADKSESVYPSVTVLYVSTYMDMGSGIPIP